MDAPQFSEALRTAFLKPSTGRFPSVATARGRTLLFSIVDGRIHSGEAGLRPLTRELEQMLQIQVEFSKVLKGGKFDNGQVIKLLGCDE